jgi:hypothetical protein
VDIKEAINKEFNTYVVDTFRNSTIRQFLLNHERRNLLVSNLQEQIALSEHVILPLDKTQEEKRAIIKGLAADFAKMFCETAIKVKEAELTPDIMTIGEVQSDD